MLGVRRFLSSLSPQLCNPGSHQLVPNPLTHTTHIHSHAHTHTHKAEAILTLVVKGLDKDKAEKRSTVTWERVALQVGIAKAVLLCLRSRAQFAHPSEFAEPGPR